MLPGVLSGGGGNRTRVTDKYQKPLLHAYPTYCVPGTRSGREDLVAVVHICLVVLM